MGGKTLTDDTKLARARMVCAVLRDAGGWVSTGKLIEETGLTAGQIKAAVKYNRRWFLDHPTRCETYYILSGPKGYKLPQDDEDYLNTYKSMYSWAISVLVTISPVGKYLQFKGYDMAKVRAAIVEETDDDEIGGADSWQEIKYLGGSENEKD